MTASNEAVFKVHDPRGFSHTGGLDAQRMKFVN
jgi:hypothetical protein